MSTSIKCYQKCTSRSEDGFCTRKTVTLDARGACLYKEQPDTDRRNFLDYTEDGN